MSLFTLRGVNIRYVRHCALCRVDFSIAAGRTTALIGPSGCGKTSLLTALNRLTDLVPGCQVDGSIVFDGRDIHGPEVDTTELRRRVGMIFQKPNPFPISIRRNLELALIEHGYQDAAARRHVVEESLRAVGLWDEVKDRLEASALGLSGGQQQRLCIARALALQPEVLLMDEPCSALDPLASGVVEDLIVQLRERFTVVVVTHNLAQARRIADDVGFFWLQNGCGRLVEAGKAQDVFENPREELTEAYVRGRRG